MKTEITKAVLPVAGLGTRLRPLTYHQPKGMVGIVDKPLIHYVIDELVSEGIRHIIFVTSEGQHQFQTYTDYLQADPEWKQLGIKFDFTIQKELKGSADALLTAKEFLNDEPFLVYFGDELLAGKESSTRGFIKNYQKTKSPILVLHKVAKDIVERYGIVKSEEISPGFHKITDLVEKPKKEEAPSDLAAMGRYLLTTDIFNWIGKAKEAFVGKKEIAIADALGLYVKNGAQLNGWVFEGEIFDVGSKLGLLQAQAYYGLQHPEFKEEFHKFLKKIVN
ncbi:MAG: UTP--glucose-1-phosphate uridylyltransferase [Parcubacteria group bacterium Gr01-1014_19]|nr:MAG: UTP--glucose-1-phosphate uridylyltransferase [Parcubacteria group bacterium Gr01-1014_19]